MADQELKSMGGRGWSNDNHDLVRIEQRYLYGDLRNKKLNTIKEIRALSSFQVTGEGETHTIVGLKDVKDLTEIWDGTIPTSKYGTSRRVLNYFGYFLMDTCDQDSQSLWYPDTNRSGRSTRGATQEAKWLEIRPGMYQRIDQIKFVNFTTQVNNGVDGKLVEYSELIMVECIGSEKNIFLITPDDCPNFFELKVQLLKLVGAKVDKKSIPDDAKIGRRFNIE